MSFSIRLSEEFSTVFLCTAFNAVNIQSFGLRIGIPVEQTV